MAVITQLNPHKNGHENISGLWQVEMDYQLGADKRKITVLVVEDSEVDFEILKRNLRQMNAFEAEIYHACDLVSARGIAEIIDIDVALIDYHLGPDSGVRSIQDFGGRCGNCVNIMVSGMPEHEVAQIALNAGAINYINKNHINPILLETTIRSALHTHRIEKVLKNTVIELERANKSKCRFFSRMSHDLKTPLNAILGYSQAIKLGIYGEKDEQKYVEAIGNIEDAGTQLLNVINDLIIQSSYDGDVDSSEFQLVDLTEIVANSVSVISSYADSLDHKILVEEHPAELSVECQSGILQQAIVNLLTNAIKYTPNGGTICVSTHELHSHTEIHVTDNGVGMTPNEIEEALKPYGRVGPVAGSNSKEGTGIGLSIVEEIIERHSGALEITSEKDEGTRCIVKLPKPQQGHQAA